ncbi:MAG: hypothetical protein J1F63_01570 [Oscillospiraceae bacterium]|nr:hypothetical protein [Oscillospiraceae bacterium]
MLTALMVYAVIYFSYSPFMDHSYGFGDMYTHHSWTYGLVQGQIFSDGVYPEGMHCVLYIMHTVSGLQLYNCTLFLGCINMFVYVLAAYCLMRDIFHWRGTPMLVLTAFLVLGVKSADLMVSMARLQRSLPGEYGLYSMFICALFLLRFLKEELPDGWHKKPKEWFKNENLIMFAMALAASIVIHFYVTITAFFVCLPFAIVFIRRVLSRKRFLPLVAAAMCGLFISVLPMVGALISGIPFQGSIGWALAVIEGEEEEFLAAEEGGGQTEETEEPEQTEPETFETDAQIPQDNVFGKLPKTYVVGASSQTSATGDAAQISVTGDDMQISATGDDIQIPVVEEESHFLVVRDDPHGLMIWQRPGSLALWHMGPVYKPTIRQRLQILWWRIRAKAYTFYSDGYSRLFDDYTIGRWLVRISVLIAAFCLIYRLLFMLIRPLRKWAGAFDNYLPIIGASVFILILYAAPYLALPELIAFIRLPSTAYILLLMITAMVIDIPLSLLQRFSPNWLQQTVALAGMAAICYFTIKTGNYHGYFYNELTRYRSVVNVTSSITESFPHNQYTIVGSTDDLYSTIQYGRHEELLKFLQLAQKEPGYYLPTEYVFIYVEKHPIQHAQYHFSSGPAWLATDIYYDTYPLGTTTSRYPEIFATEITDEAAQWDIRGYPINYESYKNPFTRTVINSNAYKWCQDFNKLYDNELKVYYEDENFICYYFRQNTFSLYDLAIWA